MSLHTFEGRDVVSSRIAVTNAGDGLSEAMSVAPAELVLGETVYLVLEARVAKVRYEPADRDGDALARVHVLRAGLATMVAERVVRKVLNDQRRAIEEAKGQAALFAVPDEE